MKRVVYIGAFIFLGLLGATLLHAALEFPALHYLSTTDGAYTATFLGQYWDQIHKTGGALLWFAGLAAGVFCGRRYWRIIYIEKRYGEKKW